MQFKRQTLRVLLAFLAPGLFVSSCGAPLEDGPASVPERPPAEPQRAATAEERRDTLFRGTREVDLEPEPWTDAFVPRTLLVARSVTIEGPAGLRDHMASTQQPALHVYVAKATPDGLLQETRVRAPQPDGSNGVRAKLDGLDILATLELRVLERPGPVDVTVLAQGDVYWSDPATGEKFRGEQWKAVGTIEAPEVPGVPGATRQ